MHYLVDKISNLVASQGNHAILGLINTSGCVQEGDLRGIKRLQHNILWINLVIDRIG